MATLKGEEALKWIQANKGKGYTELDNSGKVKTWHDMDRGVLGNLGTSLLQPFSNLTKLTAAGVDSVANQGKPTSYLTEDERNNTGRLLLQTLAGIGSYALPVGAGGSLVKNIGLGAGSGALSSFGSSDITKDIDPGQIALGAGIGGAVPLVTKGISGILGKMRGKAVPAITNSADEVANATKPEYGFLGKSKADMAASAANNVDEVAKVDPKATFLQGGGYASQKPMNISIETASAIKDPVARTKAFEEILRTGDIHDELFGAAQKMAKLNGVSDEVINKAFNDNLDNFIAEGVKKNPQLQKYLDELIPEPTSGLNTLMPDEIAYNNELKNWVADTIRAQESTATRKLGEEATASAAEQSRLASIKNAPPTQTKLAGVKTVFDEVTPEQYTKMAGINPKKMEMSAIINDYKKAGFQITGSGPNSFDDFVNDINITEKYRIANDLPRTPEGIKEAFKISGQDIGNLRKAAQGTVNINNLVDDASNFGATKFPRTADKLKLSEALQNDIQGVYGTITDNPNLTAEGLGEVKKALQKYKTIWNQTSGVDRMKLMTNPEFMTRLRLADTVDDELTRIVGTSSGAQEAGQMYRVGMQQGENIDRVMNKIDPNTNLPTTHYQVLNEAGNFIGNKGNAVKEGVGKLLQGKNPLGSGGTPGVLSRMRASSINVPQPIVNAITSPAAQTVGASLLSRQGTPATPELPTDNSQGEEQDIEKADREKLFALWQQMINAGATPDEVTKLLGPELSKYGIGGGSSKMSAKQQTQAAQITNARNILNSMSAMMDKIGSSDSGVLARLSGGIRKAAASAGLDPDLKNYEDLKRALITPLARAMGETGIITDKDLERYGTLIPDPGESKSEWKNKMKQIFENLDFQEQTLGVS